MQQSLDAMKVALRVLQAVTDNHYPDPADVERLKQFAPLLADAPADELASDVIQQAIKRGADARRTLERRALEASA